MKLNYFLVIILSTLFFLPSKSQTAYGETAFCSSREEAKRLYRKGYYLKSRKCLLTLLSKNSDNYQNRLLYGKVLNATGQPIKAYRILSKLPGNIIKSQDDIFALAYAAYYYRNKKLSIKMFKRIKFKNKTLHSLSRLFLTSLYIPISKAKSQAYLSQVKSTDPYIKSLSDRLSRAISKQKTSNTNLPIIPYSARKSLDKNENYKSNFTYLFSSSLMYKNEQKRNYNPRTHQDINSDTIKGSANTKLNYAFNKVTSFGLGMAANIAEIRQQTDTHSRIIDEELSSHEKQRDLSISSGVEEKLTQESKLTTNFQHTFQVIEVTNPIHYEENQLSVNLNNEFNHWKLDLDFNALDKRNTSEDIGFLKERSGKSILSYTFHKSYSELFFKQKSHHHYAYKFDYIEQESYISTRLDFEKFTPSVSIKRVLRELKITALPRYEARDKMSITFQNTLPLYSYFSINPVFRYSRMKDLFMIFTDSTGQTQTLTPDGDENYAAMNLDLTPLSWLTFQYQLHRYWYYFYEGTYDPQLADTYLPLDRREQVFSVQAAYSF